MFSREFEKWCFIVSTIASTLNVKKSLKILKLLYSLFNRKLVSLGGLPFWLDYLFNLLLFLMACCFLYQSNKFLVFLLGNLTALNKTGTFKVRAISEALKAPSLYKICQRHFNEKLRKKLSVLGKRFRSSAIACWDKCQLFFWSYPSSAVKRKLPRI